MLGGVRLKVVYTHEKSCFAYISPKYSTNNEQSQCIQVIARDKQTLLWVVFSSSVLEGQMACNPVFSRLIGLEEGWEVFVSPYGDIKILEELFVETDSPDDQEILNIYRDYEVFVRLRYLFRSSCMDHDHEGTEEFAGGSSSSWIDRNIASKNNIIMEHNVELLQMRILDHLRVVVANQKAIVWISASLPVVFTPKQTGLLVTHSRVVVRVDPFDSFRGMTQNISTVPEETTEKFKNIGSINEGMLRPHLNAPERLVLRAVPIDSDGKRNSIHPYIVFMHENQLADKHKKLTAILATMMKIPLTEVSEVNTENNNNQINDLCVEIVLIDSVVFRSLCHEVYHKNIPTILVPKSLNAIINIENGTKLILTIIGDKVSQPDHIDIVTYSDQIQSETDVIDKFKNCVIDNTHSGKKFLINHGMIKRNAQICHGFLQLNLKPDNLKYTLLNCESFRHCTLSAKCLSDSDLELPKLQVSKLEYDCKNYCRNMKSMETLVQKVVSHIYFEIHREASFKGVSEIKGNVLITGLSGAGKSSLCHIVQKELTVWSHILQCRSLKGRKDIPEELGKHIVMCQKRSPAVLICDNVHSLVPPSMEGTSPQDIAYYQRLAVAIKHTLRSCPGVCVLMTADSMKSLHPTLSRATGSPMFTAHFDIAELQQDERTELFKHLINDKIREQFDVQDDDVIRLSMDTAGNTVRDIIDYFNKKVFKAVKKKKANPDDPKPRLVEDSSKDEEKSKAFDIWGPVGGLHSVKQELTECIFWPIMYPALFPSQSCGILLYGPPGTGKSHIGSCLARISNMNMITVKGPELFSKYIGQSEKAVRDVFDKADMKRPCILFFDEFDSLAPKRGHDSTGVSDRVVNQLLARLDGVEGGARGPVIAATSRPDLIDPAMLRAGRLQRHIYTELPDSDGRYEVLQTLCKNASVDASVDLRGLSVATDGFSPADLKSLLVTAQLARLDKQLSNSDNKDLETVVVDQEDIDSALRETKPSLSKEQRLFYDMIYKRFRGESLSPQQKQISTMMQKQRVTLA